MRNKAGPPVPLSATTAFGIDVIDRAAANASLAALDAAAYRETSDPIDMEG